MNDNIFDLASQLLGNKKLQNILYLLIALLVGLTIFYGIKYIPGSFSGNQLQRQAEQNLRDYPIQNNLPYQGDFYALKMDKDDQGVPVILVETEFPLQRKKAIDRLNQFESNASAKYKIVFDHYQNPFPKSSNGGQNE